MADIKISALPAAGALTGAEVVPAVQGGNTVKATIASLKAFASQGGLGFGQTWQDLTSSRSLGTTYTNSTGKPLVVLINYDANTFPVTTYNLNGLTVNQHISGNDWGNLVLIVPDGQTYMVSSNGQILQYWLELR